MDRIVLVPVVSAGIPYMAVFSWLVVWTGKKKAAVTSSLVTWSWHLALVPWVSSMWPLSPHDTSSSRAPPSGCCFQQGSLDFLSVWLCLGSEGFSLEVAQSPHCILLEKASHRTTHIQGLGEVSQFLGRGAACAPKDGRTTGVHLCSPGPPPT